MTSSHTFSHFHIVLLIVHGVNILVNISHSFDTGQPMVGDRSNHVLLDILAQVKYV